MSNWEEDGIKQAHTEAGGMFEISYFSRKRSMSCSSTHSSATLWPRALSDLLLLARAGF